MEKYEKVSLNCLCYPFLSEAFNLRISLNQEFTDALSIMTSLANKRQRDLTQSCQRERIITALSVLKKCLSSLSVVMQNYVKYSSNPQAEVSAD